MMLKILDGLMWFMFAVSFVFSVITILVVYGIRYFPKFVTFYPLEIALALSFFLWGINSLFNPYISHGKYSFYLAFIFGGVLVAFAVMGVY